MQAARAFFGVEAALEAVFGAANLVDGVGLVLDAFLALLAEGRPLSEAAAAGFLATPRFDFASALTSLLLSGALTGWRLPDPI